MYPDHVDVLVIGGGLAGLSSAVLLVNKGYEVVVCEKGPFLGGRASSFQWKDRTIDNGQHLHIAGYDHYLNFLREIGLSAKIHTQKKLSVDLTDTSSRKGKIESSLLPPPFHLITSLARYPFLPLKDRLETARPVLSGWLKPITSNHHHISFSDWLNSKRVSNNAVKKLWDPIIIPTLNAPSSRVSAAAGLMIVKKLLLSKAGGRLGYLTTPMGAIGGSAQDFLETRTGAVLTACPVKKLVSKKNRIDHAVCGKGHKITAHAFISAVPFWDLGKFLPPPLLSKINHGREQLFDWNPIVNVHLFYDRPILNKPFQGVIGGDLQWMFNLSIIQDSPGHHLAITLSYAKEYVRKSPEKIKDLIVDELEKLFPAARRGKLNGYLVIKQPKSTFLASPGCEHRRPDPGEISGNLFLAGDWINTNWPSTMESAVKSGVLAGKAVHDFIES